MSNACCGHNHDHEHTDRLIPESNTRKRLILLCAHRIDDQDEVVESLVHIWIEAANDEEAYEKFEALVMKDHQDHGCKSHLHPAGNRPPVVFNDACMDLLGEDLSQWAGKILSGTERDMHEQALMECLKSTLPQHIQERNSQVLPYWVSVAGPFEGSKAPFYGVFLVHAESTILARNQVLVKHLGGNLGFDLDAVVMDGSTLMVVEESHYNRHLQKNEVMDLLEKANIEEQRLKDLATEEVENASA